MKRGRFLILLGCSLCMLALACGSGRRKADDKMRGLLLRPPIMSRQAWDERLPSGSFMNHTPARIVIVDEGEIARRITAPIKYLNYVRRRGPETGNYTDVPYHFYIDKTGKIYAGRMLQAVASLPGSAAASPGDVYVSFMDDFSINEPNDKEIGALVQLVAWLVDSNELDPARSITTDRELGRGPSPGAFLAAWMQEGNLLTMVRELVPEKEPEPEF